MSASATRAISRPLPALEGLSGEFYDWCRKGELRFQRCSDCRTWRHVPRLMCAACGSFEWTWERSSGRGRLYTWTVVVRALHPAFAADTPMAPAVIQLEEGVRLLSQVIDCAGDDLEIDMPVEVCFDAVSDEVHLPKFRRTT